ncbi:hypothetical protein Vafri_15323 [Volvox africanus]|uniref:Uncharacterized protein n=1 Tax=Volvox africanus TaxID=51714 RepID=A0A8J4BG52_9CHLO|nr:hypothetical protein Vafri_15323 [Volvox africanus]
MDMYRLVGYIWRGRIPSLPWPQPSLAHLQLPILLTRTGTAIRSSVLRPPSRIPCNSRRIHPNNDLAPRPALLNIFVGIWNLLQRHHPVQMHLDTALSYQLGQLRDSARMVRGGSPDREAAAGMAERKNTS